MVLHCVFCQFRPDVPLADKAAVFDGLKALTETLDGALAFDSGPNVDIEAKSPNYSDGFVIRFQNRAALATYADHPTHKKLGAELCDFCVGGAAGIIVFDLEV